MFTGLIEEVGEVKSFITKRDIVELEIKAQNVLEGTKIGDSVAIDGVCQTVTQLSQDGFCVQALEATLSKTTFRFFTKGRKVNLERALTLSSRLGGHLVQGHASGIGKLKSVEKKGHNIWITIQLPASVHRYCVEEGSITVDGISLTIASLQHDEIQINVIPETWMRTTLSQKNQGQAVNLETDIIARYLDRLVGQKSTEIDNVLLNQWGYIEN